MYETWKCQAVVIEKPSPRHSIASAIALQPVDIPPIRYFFSSLFFFFHESFISYLFISCYSMIFESTTSGNKAKLNLQRTIYPRPCPSSNARSAYYIEMMRAATRFSTFPAKLPSDENRYFATERTFDITIHSMFYHGIFFPWKKNSKVN